MMQTGRATVIDLSLSPIAGQSLFRLALWNDAARARIGDGLGVPLPGPCRAVAHDGVRLLSLEQDHWLVACATPAAESWCRRIEALAGADAALVEVGAALVGRRLVGTGWRDLLMIGGVFDAEDTGFGAGCVARTVMHHSPLLIDVITADCADAYVPASHAMEFFGFWEAEIAR
jgi:heterotetrameric sarcosine oxidase gamma subunit